MEEKKPYEKVSYNRDYNEKNYERISFVVRKGQKEKIKAAADRAGLSVNGYIAQAITEKMQRDGFQYGEDTEE